MTGPSDGELDPSPLQGDRSDADVLRELPIDGEPVRDTQLMTDAERDEDPAQIEGDRFDVANDDLGQAPDLEDDPDAPDLQPDSVGRFAEADAAGEEDPDDVDDRLTARPTDHAPGDDLVSDDEPLTLDEDRPRTPEDDALDANL